MPSLFQQSCSGLPLACSASPSRPADACLWLAQHPQSACGDSLSGVCVSKRHAYQARQVRASDMPALCTQQEGTNMEPRRPASHAWHRRPASCGRQGTEGAAQVCLPCATSEACLHALRQRPASCGRQGANRELGRRASPGQRCTVCHPINSAFGSYQF